MKKRISINEKRSLINDARLEEIRDEIDKWRITVGYGGNPNHKRNPGDFNLDPPAQPRQGKTLCDGVNIFSRRVAIELLQEGLARGTFSDPAKHGKKVPKYIWAVSEDGHPLEAIWENPEQMTYHGYPMSNNDPFREAVLARWNETQ